jgi:hypothetical protein
VVGAPNEPLLSGPDELTVQAGALTGPTGESAVFLAPTWCGEADAGEAAVGPLARLGDPVVAQVSPVTAAELLAMTDGPPLLGSETEGRGSGR